MAYGQRVWNRQPAGGFAGLGTSPSSTICSRRAFALGSGMGSGGQERERVGVDRVRIHLIGGADLDDLAQVHHRDPVGDVADDAEVVRDEEIGELELVLEVLEQVDDLRLDRDVQGRDRLVGNDQLRPQRERPGDADPLPLAAGELVREAVVVLRAEADRLEQLLDLRASGHRPRRARGCSSGVADDLPDPLARVERRVRDPGRSSASRGARTASRARARPTISCPSKRTEPEVGGISCRMVRPSVDLPQPDSPTRPSVSPCLHGEADVVDGAHATDFVVEDDRRS